MTELNVELESRGRRLVHGEDSTQFQYPIVEYIVTEDTVIVLCDSYISKESDDPDVRLPIGDRNVVALSGDWEIEWFVDPIPTDTSYEEGNRFKAIDVVTGRLLATDRSGERFQIDVTSGEIRASWGPNRLPIGDTVVDLPEEISDVLEVDDTLIVRVNRIPDAGNLFAFDLDGTRRWRTEEYVGSIYLEDGDLWAKEAAGGRHWEKYPIDVDTGEIGETEVYQGYPN